MIELKAQLRAAKQKVTTSSDREKTGVQELMVKLTECYRLNDKQKAEIADLRNQLHHNIGNEEKVIAVDKETGEIVSGFFRK